MEIEELNQRLFELTKSECAYQRGERYNWAESHKTTVIDQRPIMRMENVISKQARTASHGSKQSQTPPLAGRLLIKQNSRFNPVPEHVHSYMEMSYVYAGSCPQQVNGKNLMLRENQLLMLDSNCPHAIGELGETDIMMSVAIEKAYLRQLLSTTLEETSMVSNFLLNVLNEQTDHNRHVLFETQANRRIRRYFQELLCEYLEPTGSAEVIILHLLQLILVELVNEYERDYTRREGGGENPRVSVIPIIRYIEDNYLTCTQEGVARRFFISPNYVSTLLKKHTGMTYRQVVQAQKLGRAASLLRNTSLPIADIARSSGYENQSFFYRKFKEYYGCLPAEYRTQRSSVER